MDNIDKYLVIEDKLELAERLLRWRHYAPTAPDQLSSYPFYTDDPFVQERCPHVFFVGNQKEFKTKLIKGLYLPYIRLLTTLQGPEGQTTRIVLVPSFADTGVVLLVNLSTLDIHPITFNTAL
jgi:DNA polymerase delta subunit 2